MSWQFRLAAGVFVIALVGGLWNSANENRKKYKRELERAESAQTVTSNVLSAIKIFNIVVEANAHAKQQIALDASRAARDVRVGVAGDSCAVSAIPAGSAQRLRQYADSIRQGSASASSSKSDD